jgi:MFS transporter, ACS family, aldohexuronate transporter
MAMPSSGTRSQSAPVSARAGYFRWTICALLFLAATINYVDRQVIGLLKPTLQQQFGWNEIDYADIVFAFQLAYAIGFVFAGRMIDRLGTKLGFSLALLVWSIAAIAHAEAPTFGPAVAGLLGVVGLTYSGSVAGFIAARFALGLGESANFPASIKTVAEWFPASERALATGLFNSGTNIGVLVAALIVPWIAYTYGWYWAFISTGVLGLFWLVLWWPLYGSPETHRSVNGGELAYIRSDPPDPAVEIPWLSLIRHRQAWAVAIAKFGTDPIWWLYLFWIPDFLHRRYGIDLQSMALPLVVIYLIADVGSIGGGWLSSSLLKHGWSRNTARKTAMLTCALAVTPIAFAAVASTEWIAVLLVGLAASAHQGWSANVYTLASDMFPRKAVGSVIGFAGMSGSIGGMLIAKVTGYILQATGSYVPVFMVAASAYLVTLLVVHLLVPRLEPARIEA